MRIISQPDVIASGGGGHSAMARPPSGLLVLHPSPPEAGKPTVAVHPQRRRSAAATGVCGWRHTPVST